MFLALLWTMPEAFGLQLVTDPALLCSTASRVVIAEVTSAEVTRVSGSPGDLETTTWLSVHDVLLGTAPAKQTLSVSHRGGVLGPWSHWVEDQPKLVQDHRYLLLLDGHTPARVIGGELGAIDIGFEQAGLDAAVRRLGGCL